MKKNKLTIFIPSYNRPEKALRTLLSLCDQLEDGVCIKVVDNHSQTNYRDYFLQSSSVLPELVESGKVSFIRHEQNVGMSANFMKTFELCNTEWLWMVADDDDIHSNVISKIIMDMEKVANKKDVVFIKFCSKVCPVDNDHTYLHGLTDLIDFLYVSKDNFNSFIFLTNGLYRMPQFKAEIETGYHYGNTYVPHLMMLINQMANFDGHAKIYMSPTQVATYVIPEMGYSYGLLAGLGVGAFKNFTYNLSSKKYRQLEAVFAPHNDYKVAIDLYFQAKYGSNPHVARRLMDNYYLQIRRGRSLPQRLTVKLFYQLFYFPPLFELMLKIVSQFVPSIGQHIAEINQRYKK